MTRLEKEAVIAALTVEAVLAHFHIETHGRPTPRGEVRVRNCPKCGEHTRADAVGFNLQSGRWSCYVGSCGGDLLTAIAGWSGLAMPGDFQRVLVAAAGIAGVTEDHDPQIVARLVADRRRQEQERAAKSVRERQMAVRRAGGIWARAWRWDDGGAAYLAGRGLDPHKLAATGLVRFLHGSPAVPLHSSAGLVINVVTRKVDPGDGPKCPGLTGAPGRGTLCGKLERFFPGRQVVITEGVMDTLAGMLAWPGALVLGAHSWIHLEAIGQAVAKMLPTADVLLVPHRDPPTEDAPAGVGRKGVDLALAALGGRGRVVELVHKDLADAWQAGWRP